MKLLIIYADKFSYKTNKKGLNKVDFISEEKEFKNCLIGFIHFEERDEENLQAIETKMIKNLKWAARKNETKRIILHAGLS